MANQRVLLAGAELPAETRGEIMSGEARRLLSQLAAGLGLYCPESQWSPRGAGPPKHPMLTDNWFAGITHKYGQVIVGLSDRPFGIDLEYFNPRHAGRLPGLVELLPELQVQQAIRQAACPQQAFYQAWTLHEALFKLSSQTTQPVNTVLETRLQPAMALAGHVSLWQSPDWTVAIVGCAPLALDNDMTCILPGTESVQWFQAAQS